MSKAFGEQNPTQSEEAVSWQTWSDGSAGIPNVVGDSNWGKLKLPLSGAEGRSAVYDLGSENTRTFTINENRYGTGSEQAVLQIRTSTSSFLQDDVLPTWTTYSGALSVNCRYVQIRESTLDTVIYFVDATGGNNANDGLSEANAWQTLVKVNSVTLNPGDYVLFKRGEVFSGLLWPENYGTDNSPITFGAYGTGNRPNIAASGNLACTIQISYGAHHLRFDHIDFSGCNATGSTVVDCHTHDVYFYDCIFRDGVGGSGLTAYDTGSTWGYNVTADTCQAYDNDHAGFSFASYSGMNHIKNCIAHDNGTTAWADHGIYSRHGCIIENCVCYNNPVGAGIKVNCEGVYTSAEFPTIRNNVCYGNYLGIQIDNINSLVYNNLCYGNAVAALAMSYDAAGGLIYYNTFVNSTTAGEYLIRAEGNISGVTLKNNLFIQDAAVRDDLILGLFGGTEGCDYLASENDWDYNTYYHSTVSTAALFTDSLYTWADWQGWGAEANGTRLLAVPGFVARYTNMHPADSGNLKGLGVAITGYELDLDGNTRTDPPTPGCYEESAP